MCSSDIRIGDFWGKAYLKDQRGVSLVTINHISEKGKALFEKIKDRITFKQHVASDCISYQSWGKNYKIDSELRKNMFASLADPKQTILDTVRLFWQSRSTKTKLKQVVKNIILMMPRPIVIFFKRLI